MSRVSTFALSAGGVTLLEHTASLAEATARLPSGAYTTLRTYGGDGIVRLRDHVKRLEESAAAQGTPGRLDENRMRRWLAEVLRAAGHTESRLRLTSAPPQVFACVEPFEPPPEHLYEQGAWCVTVSVRRDVPRAKDTRFAATAIRTYQDLPPGAHEGLIVGDDGAILEGLSSNFFALCAGKLHSEGERALAGVTRAVALELAGVPLVYQALRVDDLPRANECFLTSVSREVMPVVRVDGQTIGDGHPGGFVRDLRARFRARMLEEADHVLS